MGDKSFGRAGKSGIQSNFSVYHFEGICTGLLSRIDCIDPDNSTHIENLKAKIEELKSDQDFINVTTGGGKNSPGPLNKRVQLVTDKLADLPL